MDHSMIPEFLNVAICAVAEDYEELLDKLPSDIQVGVTELNSVIFCYSKITYLCLRCLQFLNLVWETSRFFYSLQHFNVLQI